jgi:dGTP triphosphohydrolase
VETPRSFSLDYEYEATREQLKAETWVSYLFGKCLDQYVGDSKGLREAKDRLSRLVSVVHFISGLTDRYCSEIFYAIHPEYLV